jgi:hypothetical protein
MSSGESAILEHQNSDDLTQHSALLNTSPFWMTTEDPDLLRGRINELEAEVERLRGRLVRNEEIGT